MNVKDAEKAAAQIRFLLSLSRKQRREGGVRVSARELETRLDGYEALVAALRAEDE